MRARSDIDSEYQAHQNIGDGRNVLAICWCLRLILEVLLDIREILGNYTGEEPT
jgi:hypothetical protein